MPTTMLAYNLLLFVAFLDVIGESLMLLSTAV